MAETVMVRKISFVVFLITIAVVSIYMISLVFPAFIVTSVEQTPQDEKFVLGEHAKPFIFINVIIFTLGISAYLKILPVKIINVAKFVFSYEISKKVSIICLIVLIAVYVIFNIEELSIDEFVQWQDYRTIEEDIKKFPPEIINIQDNNALRIVKNFLLHTSLTIFQNVKVIPFLASIGILFLTYLFTVQLTQKRMAGLISIIVLLQSQLFLMYDTTATYDNFWTLFLIFSLYIMFKKWHLSIIGFILSALAKAVTLLFLPAIIYQILRINMPKKHKYYSLIIYGVIFTVMLGLFFSGVTIGVNVSTFSLDEFLTAFAVMPFQIRFDFMVLWFLLPVTITLFLISRKGSNLADIVLVMILVSILSPPLLNSLTGFEIQPYRYMPLIVFFAVGVGFVFSRNHKTGWSTVIS